MINNILERYTLGCGGIGDFLLTLACAYDNVEEMNLVFFANNVPQIKELVKLFPKIKKNLILEKDFNTLNEFYHSEKCINKGILPQDLNYNNWYKVDIFKEYNVDPRPNFIRELFKPKKIFDNQIFVQKQGSQIDGFGKQRILLKSTIDEIYKEFSDYNFIFLEDLEKPTYKDIFELILGSNCVIGCDSFCKTFSSLAGIYTIVYDNLYDQKYLDNFRDKRDYGHYVFLDGFSNIKLRKQ